MSLSDLGSGIIALALDLLILYAVWRSAREWGRSALLDADGKRVDAKIVGIWIDYNRRSKRCFAAYQFILSTSKHRRVVYKKEQEVSGRHLRRLKKGDVVEVLYLPDYPKTSKLAGVHVDNSLRANWTIFAVIGMLIFPFPPLILVIWLAFFVDKRFGIVSAKH